MPTSTPEACVVGVTGNIVSIESDAPLMKNSIAFVQTGDASLKGEVLRVQGHRADLQIFEETQGVRVGDRVELTTQMLSATLGPGLLGMIYDGLQNPLEALAQRDGFFLVRGFADPAVGQGMLDRVVEISREADGRILHERYVVTPEQNLAGSVAASSPAELRVSKIFKLHRDAVFRDFIASQRVLEIGRALLGPRLDCFLSQFIFKNPGAWGQPWHQDSHYFPFDRAPQVGLWLAITEATGTRIPPYIELLVLAMRGRVAEAVSLIEQIVGAGQGITSIAHLAAAILYNGLGRYQDARAAAETASSGTLDLFTGMWALPELVEAAVHTEAAEIARHAVERGFVELTLGIGLLGLGFGAVQVAHHLGDGNEVAGVDLGLILLGAARPHRALHAGLALKSREGLLDHFVLGQLAHADALELRGGDAKGHLVLLEVDNEQLKLRTGDLLLFDADDAANAMGRIHDVLVRPKSVSLLGSFLFRHAIASLLKNYFVGAKAWSVSLP